MNPFERIRATYRFQKVDRLFRREFYIWGEAIDRWKKEGMPAGADLQELLGFDEPGDFGVGRLGWCEPEFVPAIETKVLEATDEYEIVRDNAGRTVKLFKGRTHGFMPTYLKHAVSTDRDWHEGIEPLLSPHAPRRWLDWDKHMATIRAAEDKGQMIVLTSIGGYMYLRSLVGPEGICYLFMDNPALVHKMMKAWLELADAVATAVQSQVELDIVFLAEDICYNHGLLISPEMVREFLFPYYQQLLHNVRRRQGHKKVYFQLDTDGNVSQALDLYRGIGMEAMTPFEVAAGNDVLEIARNHPDLVILGGIDKRVLAEGPKEIDACLKRIVPEMVRRGGFIPTCDHGVPDNVSYANYMHYRRRMMEMDH